MIEVIKNFCYMGGYGYYIFSAYGSVLIALFFQWVIIWRRTQKL